MVRNYVKKTDGPSWSHETLQIALEAIRNGTSIYVASSQYKIPRATLFDHMTGRRGQKSNSLGRPTALTTETEKTLVNLIRTMEKNGFGLSRKEVVELVAEYEVKSQSPAKCSINDWVLVKIASKKTIKHFIGQVKAIKKGVPTIKYARKLHKAKKDSIFTYPIIDDICDLKHSEDLVAVLPEPEISRRGHIMFKIHFDKFNVQ